MTQKLQYFKKLVKLTEVSVGTTIKTSSSNIQLTEIMCLKTRLSERSSTNNYNEVN